VRRAILDHMHAYHYTIQDGGERVEEERVSLFWTFVCTCRVNEV